MSDLSKNVWELNQWYDQNYAGNVDYTGVGELFSLGGDNDKGVLGQNNEGDATRKSSPVQIPGTTWQKFASGSGDTNYHRGMIKNDGTLWFWGANQYGIFGNNNTIDRSSPVQCPGTTWNSVSLQNIQSMAVKTDGTLWTWGIASNGVLGLNGPDNLHQSSPCQVGTDTTWSSTRDNKDKITSGYRNNSAIKTDGTLWTWGRNDNGQIGDNSRTQRSSPTQVPGTTWNSNAMMIYACLATKTDGTLWSWGRNESGALGLNDRNSRSSPTQIPGTTWGSLYISASRYTVRVVKTDGTLWAWGNNVGGGLGQNNNVQYSSPVQIPGTNWKQVSVSDDGQTTAVKTDGTLWGWGYNGKGGLGLNNTVQYSSPIQIPGTDWHLTRSARQTGYALKLK